ncbi:PaaI family thioesterase [Gordonia hydrophobica]|uniref:Acyl-coenzyme A thioesterase THEM4 n=1 Tax=Gordonia hydrophobica TaxID=40516 RepID=A0ABZ2TWF8_9ACTN|nr:PaaI family thioesterase [Gordonia hydrophobica]MBM7365890.1 acyl-coenzyme A thioesterase PaaI-like protein [Gordonia hydrophobica]
MDFRLTDMTDEEIAQDLSVVEPLTDSVRDLIDAVIRTEVDAEHLIAAREQIEAVVASLRAEQKPGSYGVPFTKKLHGMPYGNAAVGKRNAIAPPLEIEHQADGSATSKVVLGAAYEGPAGLVHGGISAMLLDQLLGEAVSRQHGIPCFTGTLTMTYLRPTPLGALRLRAETTGNSGRKYFVRAEICDADGPTVTAEAIMVAPANFPRHEELQRLRAQLAEAPE